MPANTVSVSRPSPWGNPYEVRFGRTAEACVELFRQFLKDNRMGTSAGWMLANIDVLRGKNLACWCAEGSACHADVLLELANKPDEMLDDLDALQTQNLVAARDRALGLRS